MNRCRKCGKEIEEKRGANVVLWCDKCRKEVDKELDREIDNPFKYYFKYQNAKISTNRSLG